MSLVRRIADHVAAAAGAEPFEPLALAAFEYQFDRVAPFRALCERRGVAPGTIDSWRQVPLVPTEAFATVDLHSDPAREVFRSSGTTGARRSVHHHPFPELYRAVIDATFPAHCLPRGDRPPMLALMPPRGVAPDSSLGFMVAHALERFGGEGSAWGTNARGVEVGTCRSWLGIRQRAGTPVLVLATAFALDDLLERIERMNLHFRLPTGSAIFETGGFKGRRREVSRAGLLERAAAWLGVPPGQVVSEYGMTELTSHAYTRTLAGGDPELFVPPPWLRARVLDPVTLEERPAGEIGLLAFFDLANVGSALHVLSADLGRLDGPGFRLEGRAPDADLRGCSLLAEELAD
ncbi:MAG TPA: acyl-protein synthetase [Thermoanaerobaculia bacterium]|nr:acyl-protein synthetase [Thermoanaerobaculia bacterium]